MGKPVKDNLKAYDNIRKITVGQGVTLLVDY